MVKYYFPILKTDELVKDYKDTLPELDKNAIENPKPNTVENVFKTLVSYIEPDQEDPENIDFSGLEILFHDGEIHKESIPQATFLMKCIHLMQIAGIKDFSIKDLISPDSSRFIIQLSALINFLKYYDEKTNVFKDQVDKIEDFKEKKEKCIEESQVLINQLKDAEYFLFYLEFKNNLKEKKLTNLKIKLKKLKNI